MSQTTQETFAESLLETLNRGALGLMVSLGHRTGLFDTLAALPASTSAEIAAAAGLNERYVREWLGAMTAGRIVDFDATSARYRLPAEHAACLTRAATPNNLAAFAQYLSVLGSVEDDVLRCFREGGGVPYARFARFHEVMAEDSGQSVLGTLESHLLPLAPGLRERLERGIDVLDAGCGRALVPLRLAELFPRSRFTGFDLSEEAIGFARAEARRRGLTNIRFEVRDLSTFDVDADPEAYDWVTTFDAIHDQAKPEALVRGIARTLRPSGLYLAQDIKAAGRLEEDARHPLGPFLYAISCMHCMTVSLAQGGEGYGTMWGRERAKALFHRAGFRTVELHELAHDLQNDYYLLKKEAPGR
jgi:2-polyprenyl-3-methyl-5-hydroxy-6-metoxy-1,4-benzoquinol methylase